MTSKRADSQASQKAPPVENLLKVAEADRLQKQFNPCGVDDKQDSNTGVDPKRVATKPPLK
jgi:hypothetical protein